MRLSINIFSALCLQGALLAQTPCPSSSDYRDANGICQPCDPNCLTCDKDRTYCTSCNLGYYLQAISTTRICVPCDISCTTCVGRGSLTQTNCGNCGAGKKVDDSGTSCVSIDPEVPSTVTGAIAAAIIIAAICGCIILITIVVCIVVKRNRSKGAVFNNPPGHQHSKPGFFNSIGSSNHASHHSLPTMVPQYSVYPPTQQAAPLPPGFLESAPIRHEFKDRPHNAAALPPGFISR